MVKSVKIIDSGAADGGEEESLGVYRASAHTMPIAAREKFKRLKRQGKIRGSFSDFIVEATLARLDKEK